IDRLIEIKNIFFASKAIIETEGIHSYLYHVKIKLSRNEWKLASSTKKNNSSNANLMLWKPKKRKPISYSNVTKDRNKITSKYNISVVIPTNSTKEQLYDLIKQIFLQRGLSGIELVLLNSGKDNLSRLKDLGNVKIIDIPSNEFNHGRTRNLGISQATGDYIVVQTDDAIPINSYVYYDMCEKFSQEPKLVAVSARQVPRSDSDLVSQFTINQHYFYLKLTKDTIRSSDNFDKLNFQEKRRVAQIDDVCTCYKRDIIKKYQFKEIQYAEDLDLGIRLIKDGFKICQLYESAVIHSHNRPSVYHFKRGFIDSSWLVKLLNQDTKSLQPQEYSTISEFSFDVFHLFNAVNNVVVVLRKKNPVRAQEAFDILRQSLPFY
ncbi:MAG: glycosyltransferase, partial [Patescibacteria group bacterium]|nr:glycosyltransferase [Patescibacteria group bacterium]